MSCPVYAGATGSSSLNLSPLTADTAIASRSRLPITRNELRRPTEKACPTPTCVDSRTASKLGSKPKEPMVAVTIAVAMARLMMLAPLRTRFSNDETLLYFCGSTELNTELLLGE